MVVEYINNYLRQRFQSLFGEQIECHSSQIRWPGSHDYATVVLRPLRFLHFAQMT